MWAAMVRMNLSSVASQFVLVSFRKTESPGCAGESKKAFAVSFERSGMVYNIKRCSTQREEPCLQGAWQGMQEAENTVPLERLAGSMALQGLRRPPALPGAWPFCFSDIRVPKLCRRA